MNGVILYQSKYGATKRYAEWLSEETGFKCIETKKADINEIIAYDPIILGGGIYASGIAGLSFLKKNINKLTDKKIIVFCCGASPYEENAFLQIKEHNMKDNLSDIPVFYCRGAWIWTQCLSKIELCAIYLERLLQRKIHLITKYGKRH